MAQPPSGGADLSVDALYRDHQSWLITWLWRRLGSRDEAQDVAQDTFMKILQRPVSLEEIREPRSWLATIAGRLVVDQARRRRLEQVYQESLQLLPEATVPGPEEHWLILEALHAIDAMLAGLKPRVRTAFLLSRLEGLSYQKIAERMDMSVSSIEKYMAIAIRHCYLTQQDAG